MKQKGIFDSYYARLSKEGFVKSLLCGLCVAAGVLCVVAFGLWMSGAKGFWIAIIAWAAALFIATPLFYFVKFRPTTKEMAKRVDMLGLEERILTMTELEGDDSFIAMKQREDAKNALEKVNASLIKFAVSVPLIIAVCAVTVLGSGLITISALADAGVIKPGKDILGDGKVEFVDMVYSVDDDMHGYIDGDFIQRVEKGGDCIGVLAVAEDGWVFKKWSDGLEEPFRQDVKVTADAEYVAIFQELGEEKEEEQDKEGEPDTDGIKKEDPSDSDGQSKPGNDGKGDGSGSIKWEPTNQVLDNKTYYGDIYDDAKKNGIDKVSQNGDIPKTGKDLVSDYYKGTEPKGNK